MTLGRAQICLTVQQVLGVQYVKQNLDQYQYLGNRPPTLPLTQQQSIDNKLGLMLGGGGGGVVGSCPDTDIDPKAL